MSGLFAQVKYIDITYIQRNSQDIQLKTKTEINMVSIRSPV